MPLALPGDAPEGANLPRRVERRPPQCPRHRPDRGVRRRARVPRRLVFRGRVTACSPGTHAVRRKREDNRHEHRHAAGRPVGPPPRPYLRRGMGRTGPARGLLPADRPFRHDRPDLQPHHGARAGAGASFPDQPVRPALFGDHGLGPGQGRSGRHAGRRSRTRGSTRRATSSTPASTGRGRTCTRSSTPTPAPASRSPASRKG